MKETQSLQIAEGTVALNRTMATQAQGQLDLSILQAERVEIQQEQVQVQLDEGATALEEKAIEHLESAIYWQGVARDLNILGATTAVIGGAIGGAAGSTVGPGGGVGGLILGALLSGPGALNSLGGAASSQANIESTQAQIAQIQNSIQQRQEELERNAVLLEKDAEIATQNIAQAGLGIQIAQQQLAITQTQVAFARDIVHFLRFKNFNHQRWAWMADIARENYRVLLSYAITAAWLAERALEFERQTEINFIRFDYWKDTDEGLLGVDELSTDIAKLEQEKLVNEQRKRQLTKTISLASISPIELARFRETGQLYFTSLEEWFERDFPTHYLRLIKGITVNIASLVPPTEGIKASLTQLGTTRTIIKRNGTFETIEIKRPPESIALSSPVGATGIFTPLIPDSRLLNPFEGNGVEGSWELSLPRASNPTLNFNTIVDVQLILHYTALDDPLKRPVSSLIAKASATYSAKLNFPDSYYHLHNPNFHADESGQPDYLVQFIVDNDKLPPNQGQRQLYSISLYLERSEKKRPLTNLRYRPLPSTESDFVAIWHHRMLPENGLLRIEYPNIEYPNVEVSGIYELSFVNDETIWADDLPQVSLPLPIDFDFNTIEEFNLFEWQPDPTNNNILVSAKTNNRSKLQLDWLKDIILMLEYDYLIKF